MKPNRTCHIIMHGRNSGRLYCGKGAGDAAADGETYRYSEYLAPFTDSVCPDCERAQREALACDGCGYIGREDEYTKCPVTAALFCSQCMARQE